MEHHSGRCLGIISVTHPEPVRIIFLNDLDGRSRDARASHWHRLPCSCVTDAAHSCAGRLAHHQATEPRAARPLVKGFWTGECVVQRRRFGQEEPLDTAVRIRVVGVHIPLSSHEDLTGLRRGCQDRACSHNDQLQQGCSWTYCMRTEAWGPAS